MYTYICVFFWYLVHSSWESSSLLIRVGNSLSCKMVSLTFLYRFKRKEIAPCLNPNGAFTDVLLLVIITSRNLLTIILKIYFSSLFYADIIEKESAENPNVPITHWKIGSLTPLLNIGSKNNTTIFLVRIRGNSEKWLLYH